jgi:hypothetical protein
LGPYAKSFRLVQYTRKFQLAKMKINYVHCILCCLFFSYFSLSQKNRVLQSTSSNNFTQSIMILFPLVRNLELKQTQQGRGTQNTQENTHKQMKFATSQARKINAKPTQTDHQCSVEMNAKAEPRAAAVTSDLVPQTSCRYYCRCSGRMAARCRRSA